MPLNNLKQFSRSFWKYKQFSLINLLGLSIGIAAGFLIFLIARYERSFDAFHGHANEIFRIVNHKLKESKDPYESEVPYPTARFLRNEYPGILATQIHYSGNINVRIGNGIPVNEGNVVFADSLFFDVLDYSGIKGFQIQGDMKKALSVPGKAILTESLAKKYFGSLPAIGQVMKLDGKLDVEVAAIIKDIPATTHLPFNFLVSYASLTNDFIGGFDLNSWNFTGNGFCYIRLNNGASVASVERALTAMLQKNADRDGTVKGEFYLQPLSDIHFNPLFERTNPSYTVSNKYLNMLLMLGVFIVLIACVNYINLSTSLAYTKAKEVGVRKTIGASKMQLFRHYMLETFILVGMAAIVAFLLVELMLPLVNRLLEKSMTLESLVDVSLIAETFGALLVVGFISGIYPALVLAGFRPIESLKSKMGMPGQSSTMLRQALVVFQFVTSIALIICTLVIARQMHYFNSKSLGFNKDAVVEVSLPMSDSARLEAFRSRLQNQAGIQNISYCLGAPISDNGISVSYQAPELPDKSEHNIKLITCDQNYLNTYGLMLMSGRWFMSSEQKQLGKGIVVNESFVKTLGYKQPAEVLGKKIQIGLNKYTPEIIGVVRDFHTNSMHQSIGPVGLMPFPEFYYAAGIRMDAGNMKSALSKIERAYHDIYPEYTYTMGFIDERLALLYKQDTRNYHLFQAFSAISIFICAIGLWGLIAFLVVRKTKEIGIRKVLGASVGNIVSLLSKDFLKLIVLALLIASPIAWYFMRSWLENFAYRVGISWWIFVLAGVLALVIALVTISFQAVRAALANPVKSLRTE